MSDDGSDFMSEAFQNYDTTEHKMSESNADRSQSDVNGEQQFTVAGRHKSGGRIAVGTVVLVFCEAIAVASKVDGEFSVIFFIAAIIGLVGAFAIWLYEEKSPEKTSDEFKDKVE